MEDNIFILSILSFIAGLLSFLSPCTLPILPAYFANTFQSDRRMIVPMTLAFFTGLALVFSIMGATATVVGSFLRGHYGFLLKAGGAVIVVMGILSFVGKGFSGIRFQRSPATSFIGSFIFGCTMAIGWTACVGPILAGILVLASTTEGALTGIFLLFIYAMGLGLPLIILSSIFYRLDKGGVFWRLMRGKGWVFKVMGRELYLHSNGMIAGTLFIIIGILMMTSYLTYLNRALPLELQVLPARIEEWILDILGIKLGGWVFRLG